MGNKIEDSLFSALNKLRWAMETKYVVVDGAIKVKPPNVEKILQKQKWETAKEQAQDVEIIK